MTALKLRRLLNADGEVVGYFSDHVAEMAARKEWDEWYYRRQVPDQSWAGTAGTTPKCRTVETPIVAAEFEDVEPGDGDRVDHFHESVKHPLAQAQMRQRMDAKIDLWLDCGATSVEVRRYLVNRYRRPGMSNRDADLGGPQEAAGVLYVLVVKAPK